MTLGYGIPRLIPEGHYLIEIDAEPVEEKSRYGGYFYRFNSCARNPQGEHLEFKFTLSPKMENYHSLLVILGGQSRSNGFTNPPVRSVVGKKFEADVRHRPSKNDKDRLVVELVNIAPVKSETLNSPEESLTSSEEKEDAPF